MRLNSKRNRLSLIISGIVIVAMVFVSVANAITRNTFADESGTSGVLAEPHFITIHDQGKKLTIKTTAVSVGEALERAGVEVLDTDIIEPGKTTLINFDNYHINIYRSRPVTIIDGKTKKNIMTASFDPKSIAESAGISVYDGDEIKLVKSTDFIETGISTTYKITRNGGQTATVETSIAYTEETREDSSLSQGETKLIQPGEEGRKVAKYSVNFVDGVEVSRELVSEETVKEPVPRITAVGSKKSVPPEWDTCANWARQAGVSENDLYSALTLIYHESGCRVNATNASSGAYGIPQALPGNKMATIASDWETNPITQIKWMANYVTGRYGGWSQAMNYWWEHHWY
ncbi:G5 domain-containing protein [Candidatus Saccharibacteria bacterium]|nr:G5 domain-containing protein [Candidatus Saccharibacteria bacterium]